MSKKTVKDEIKKGLDTEINPVGSPFAPASVAASVGVSEGYGDDQSEKFEEETDRISNEALDNTDKQAQLVYDTDPEKLNKNQKANYAKDGGQYDRFNNRDYSTTLRLAREADFYNNKPQEHMYFMGPDGPQDLGTGYERPELKTMETRAMDQSIELDTNQKKLAQELQDAVNHKDLDAFIAAWKQKYGIELDRAQAKREMRRYERQELIQDLLSKNRTKFDAEFMRGFNSVTATTLHNMLQSQPELANMLAGVLLGSATTTEQMFLERNMKNHLAESYARAAGRTRPNEQDKIRGQLDASKIMTNIAGVYDHQNRRSNSWFRGNARAQKELANGEW